MRELLTNIWYGIREGVDVLLDVLPYLLVIGGDIYLWYIMLTN